MGVLWTVYIGYVGIRHCPSVTGFGPVVDEWHYVVMSESIYRTCSICRVMEYITITIWDILGTKDWKRRESMGRFEGGVSFI